MLRSIAGQDRDTIVSRDASHAELDPSQHPADAPTLTLRPRLGTGVVFNGEVRHAGRAVRHGVRHVLVASFSICPAGFEVSKDVACDYVVLHH